MTISSTEKLVQQWKFQTPQLNVQIYTTTLENNFNFPVQLNMPGFMTEPLYFWWFNISKYFNVCTKSCVHAFLLQN